MIRRLLVALAVLFALTLASESPFLGKIALKPFFQSISNDHYFSPHCLILLPEGGVAVESLGGVATVSNDDNVLSTPPDFKNRHLIYPTFLSFFLSAFQI